MYARRQAFKITEINVKMKTDMNDKSPKVSVLIVTYNHAKLIEDTIKSVLNQNYKNMEIIITDDCSTDGTEEIIKKYAKKYKIIKPVFSEKNTGIARNFNRGFKLISGEYIAHIDGDDLMFPDKIKKQVVYLNENKDVLICAHDMEVFDCLANKSVGLFSEVVSGKKIIGKIGVESLFDPLILFQISSMMYRKSFLPPEGFEERFRYANDFLFHIKILAKGKGKLGYINEVLGSYRKHESNVTNNSYAKKIWPEEVLAILSYASAKWPEYQNIIKKRENVVYFSMAITHLKNGERGKAKIFAKKLVSEGSFWRGIFFYALCYFMSNNLISKLYYIKFSKSLWNKVVSY